MALSYWPYWAVAVEKATKKTIIVTSIFFMYGNRFIRNEFLRRSKQTGCTSNEFPWRCLLSTRAPHWEQTDIAITGTFRCKINITAMLFFITVYPRIHVALFHPRPCSQQLPYSWPRLRLSQHQDKTCVLQSRRQGLSRRCTYYVARPGIRFFSS